MTTSELDLLSAAKRGDENAFGRLVAPYRCELRAHAYRMLGSVADAEDALQDALLGAWGGLDRFEGRSSLRSWLYTITTNAALKTIRKRPRRLLPIDFCPPADPNEPHQPPLVESTWIEPIPDHLIFAADEAAGPEAQYEQREGVELAFIAALQYLPPRQRAVLILRDVLDFSAREAAEMLETTPVSIDSALQRAHKTIRERLPDRAREAAAPRPLLDAEMRRIVDEYTKAFEAADVPALAGMLADECALSMPPLREWYSGREAVAAYYGKLGLDERPRRLLPTRANALPAAAHYSWDARQGIFVPHAIHAIGVRDGKIQAITVFTMPAAFARFGLPKRLEPEP
ncbi:MAG: RNA polymerase subunit sigma-70 [Solirubrobacterales bacterium]